MLRIILIKEKTLLKNIMKIIKKILLKNKKNISKIIKKRLKNIKKNISKIIKIR